MQFLKKPFLKLQLTPHFDSSNSPTCLSISLAIEAPDVPAGRTLYRFTTQMGNLPSFKHQSKNIQAFDSSGPLTISFRNSMQVEDQQEWYADRSTSGDVTLDFVILPRVVDIHTPGGPRHDLRCDQGGLQGCGIWFLPRPDTDFVYRNIVEWDLSKSPAGTRAVSSLGEGPGALEKDANNQLLRNTVYMVGPIQSYPEKQSTDDTDYSAMYWFGKLLPNIDHSKAFNSKLFLNMASFFDDPASPTNTYRTFVRKVPRGCGGTGYVASYVLEYDEDTKTEVPENSLTALLTHEMIHSWAAIDDGEDTEPSPNAWYSEDEEARKDFWKDWYAEDMIYARGMVYLLKTDYFLAKAAKDMRLKTIRPLENIVAELAVRHLKGEKLQTEDWLELLYPYLGKERVDKDFADMTIGKTIDLSDAEVLGGMGKLVKIQQEVLDFGFVKGSFDNRVITGLKKGSRAELAGLREGDKIVWNSKAWVCKENFESNMKLVIERCVAW